MDPEHPGKKRSGKPDPTPASGNTERDLPEEHLDESNYFTQNTESAAATGETRAFEPAPTPVKIVGDVAVRNHPIRTATSLQRSGVQATCDLPLWWAIELSTNRLSFKNYLAHMDFVLCGGNALEDGNGSAPFEATRKQSHHLQRRRSLPFTDTDAYRCLKVATEAFVSVNCAVLPFSDREDWAADPEISNLVRAGDGNDITVNLDEIQQCWFEQYLQKVNGDPGVLPYLAVIRHRLSDSNLISNLFCDWTPDMDSRADACYGILREKLFNPCLIELIWSYWHEQGMLVQTMNAISRRYQNIRGGNERDPLAMLELDPLRPLSNIMWGYIQDEQHRLTVLRRVYEYAHQYGLTLEGRAVPPLNTADSRSKFLDSFHNLLYLCSVFHKQDDDTTVVSDAFPILVALRDLHMQLAEGTYNQFGDLTSTARVEMLMQQWLLARPEFREALPTRVMVDYPETWMDRVDAMKRLQDWPGANVMHFRDLARFGEQILLSIRFGDWNEAESNQAKVWARYWRSKIQSYSYSYRIVTGVDLTADAAQPQQRTLIATQPSVLMRRQLTGGGRPAPQLAAPPATGIIGRGFRDRRAARD